MSLHSVISPNQELVLLEHPVGEALRRADSANAETLFVIDGDRIVGSVETESLRHAFNRKEFASESRNLQPLLDPELLCVKEDCSPEKLHALMRRYGKNVALVINEKREAIGRVERRALDRTQAGAEADQDNAPSLDQDPHADIINTTERGPRSQALTVYTEKPHATSRRRSTKPWLS